MSVYNISNTFYFCQSQPFSKNFVSFFLEFRMKSVNVGMKFAFVFWCASSEILIRNETGTAFAKSHEKTYFFMDEKKVKLNILRPSPRTLLNSADYKQCHKKPK